MKSLYHGTLRQFLPDILHSGKLLSTRGQEREYEYAVLQQKILSARAKAADAPTQRRAIRERVKGALLGRKIRPPVPGLSFSEKEAEAGKIESRFPHEGHYVHFSDNFRYSSAYPAIGPELKRDPESVVLEFKFAPKAVEESRYEKFHSDAIGSYSLHSFPSGLKLDNLVAIHVPKTGVGAVSELLEKFGKYRKIRVAGHD
ncbi:MAG: hypothetical protein WC792_02140 [Candidatus Micrarchaeia archaeon]|jgi:hypothetical protein